MKYVAVLLFTFALVLESQAGAFAQYCGCGNPPDPRVDASGYASWCGCLGGTYNYQTTQCVGARTSCRSGPRGDTWGAIAINPSTRALGWSHNFSNRNGAESRALTACRGKCRIAVYFKKQMQYQTEYGITAVDMPATPSIVWKMIQATKR